MARGTLLPARGSDSLAAPWLHRCPTCTASSAHLLDFLEQRPHHAQQALLRWHFAGCPPVQRVDSHAHKVGLRRHDLPGNG